MFSIVNENVQEEWSKNKMPLDPNEHDIHVNIYPEPLIFLDFKSGIGLNKSETF